MHAPSKFPKARDFFVLIDNYNNMFHEEMLLKML